MWKMYAEQEFKKEDRNEQDEYQKLRWNDIEYMKAVKQMNISGNAPDREQREKEVTCHTRPVSIDCLMRQILRSVSSSPKKAANHEREPE